MLAIRLPEDIEKRLANLAEKTGRTKTWYARQALLEYLDDFEDYYLADSRVDESRMSLEEVQRSLGLEN